ncbi:MAG: hypothetical protein KKB31_02060 [Nanoarchaeota archaeon]|nr:hypothetical protein [Nanoarchaeota archaeon]
MENKQILGDLEIKFLETKNELNFQSSMEEIDEIFFIKDDILKERFVSENFSRQLCHRIVEAFMSWNEYLHSLIMPNPQNMLNLGESKVLNTQEKQEVMELMKRIMEISSRNSIIGLTQNKKAEAEFIDGAVKFWNNEFKPRMVKIITKINLEWAKQ